MRFSSNFKETQRYAIFAFLILIGRVKCTIFHYFFRNQFKLFRLSCHRRTHTNALIILRPYLYMYIGIKNLPGNRISHNSLFASHSKQYITQSQYIIRVCRPECGYCTRNRDNIINYACVYDRNPRKFGLHTGTILMWLGLEFMYAWKPPTRSFYFLKTTQRTTGFNDLYPWKSFVATTEFCRVSPTVWITY